MAKKLTEAKKVEYIKRHGACCPYCGSSQITGEHPEIMDHVVAASVECHACNKVWNDIYKLAEIEEAD